MSVTEVAALSVVPMVLALIGGYLVARHESKRR